MLFLIKKLRQFTHVSALCLLQAEMAKLQRELAGHQKENRSLAGKVAQQSRDSKNAAELLQVGGLTCVLGVLSAGLARSAHCPRASAMEHRGTPCLFSVRTIQQCQSEGLRPKSPSQKHAVLTINHPVPALNRLKI